MKKIALFHVGLAKCASTYFGDQIQLASKKGKISATYWHPWDSLINKCTAEIIGPEIVAFPQAQKGSLPIDPNKHFIASNECLTGHFPQPLRMTSYAHYNGDNMRDIQTLIAYRLREMAKNEFSDYHVKILLITREPNSWLKSVYKNLVIMGVSQLPEQYFEVFGEVLAQWANVDFLNNMYKQFFGRSNVLLLPFEMLREDFPKFTDSINNFADTELIIDNTPKNSGLSDSATEYFRQYWSKLDKIDPPLPSWTNSTVQYKEQTWKYLHNAILNDKTMVATANEIWGKEDCTYQIPISMVESLRANMQSLKDEIFFTEYLDQYFPQIYKSK